MILQKTSLFHKIQTHKKKDKASSRKKNGERRKKKGDRRQETGERSRENENEKEKRKKKKEGRRNKKQETRYKREEGEGKYVSVGRRKLENTANGHCVALSEFFEKRPSAIARTASNSVWDDLPQGCGSDSEWPLQEVSRSSSDLALALEQARRAKEVRPAQELAGL